jgi:hypothetical protein
MWLARTISGCSNTAVIIKLFDVRIRDVHVQLAFQHHRQSGLVDLLLVPLRAGFAAEKLHGNALVEFLIRQVIVGLGLRDPLLECRFSLGAIRIGRFAENQLLDNQTLQRLLLQIRRGGCLAGRGHRLHLDDDRIQIIAFDLDAFALGHHGIAEQRIQVRSRLAGGIGRLRRHAKCRHRCNRAEQNT